MVYAAAAATPLSVLVALAAPPAAHAATTTGTVELCKSGANGMTGKTFNFHITGLQGRTNPVTVTGGGCSSALKVTSGHQTVTETATGLPAGDTVSAITTSPSGDLVSTNLSARSAVINVRAGSTTSNETVVHVTNRISPAQIKICKATPASDLVGQPFTFTENNGTPFTVTAGTTSAPNCSGLTTYQAGTVVNVAEEATPGLDVGSITTSGAGTASNVNTSAGTVSVTVHPGVTIVTYTNIHHVTPPTGLIEVCKQASDPYVSGSFLFTITDSTGVTQTQSVRVGQCTAPLTVAAGNVTVSEAQRSPYYLDDVYTIPSGDLVSQNDANGSAVVTVVKSNTAETQVNFVNDTLTNEVKICKTLAANSTALAYQNFTFQVTTANGTSNETVQAGAAGTTVCQPVTFPNGAIQWLPIGSAVTITEQSQPFVQNTSVVVSPSSQDQGSAPPTARLLVGGPSVITTATFTNQALSQIELCKAVTAYAPTNVYFPITVSVGGVSVTESVKANTCTSPITVPAGTATVTETQQPNFVLQSVSVAGDGTLLSSTTSNPATVSLPFAGDTAVTFTNTVVTGSFKVCKAAATSNDASVFQLENATWNFAWSYTANGQAVTGSATLAVGQCSLVQTGIPVIDQNGNPTQITVTEGLSPTISTLSGVTVSQGTVSVNTATQTATFGIFPTGIQVATFINKAVLP
jgi:hypothetical protein